MVSRREFVAGGVVIGTTALTGCSDIPFIGGVNYTDWIPNQDNAYFYAYKPSQMVDIDELDVDTSEPTAFDRIGASDINLRIEDSSLRSSWTVIEGDFSESDIVEGFQEGSPEQGGQYNGYRFYQVDNNEFAAQDGTFVVGPDRNGLEELIDTAEGENDRLVDENDDFSLLVDELGDGDAVTGSLQSGDDFDRVARGVRFDFQEDESDARLVAVFSDESTVDEDAVREELEGDGSVSDISVSTDGRVVVASASFDTAEFNR